MELSLVFNPDPSQLSLVMKNNQVYLYIIMKLLKKNQSNQTEKISNFNLFATSANDKKECQMNVRD